MYKKYLIPLGLICSLQVSAKMVYDPVQDTIYSTPLASNINQVEYRGLLVDIIVLERRLINMHNGKLRPKKELMRQINSYLRRVGSPTALRLISDLEGNYMYYPDGSKCKSFDY